VRLANPKVAADSPPTRSPEPCELTHCINRQLAMKEVSWVPRVPKKETRSGATLYG